MVSLFTQVMLALATLVMFGAILFGALKFRKDPKFIKNLVMGFALYFLSQITLTIILQLLGTSINGLIYFAIIALNFILVSYAFLSLMKRFGKLQEINYRSMTFGFMAMSIFQSLTTYLSYFMLSFAVNKNQVATAYPDLSAEDIQKITDSIVSMTGFDVIQSVLMLVVTMLASAFALKHLIRYFEGDANKALILYPLAVLVMSNIIPELVAIITGSMTVIVILAFVAIGVGIVMLDKKNI